VTIVEEVMGGFLFKLLGDRAREVEASARTCLEVEVEASMQETFVKISGRILESRFDLVAVVLTWSSNSEGRQQFFLCLFILIFQENSPRHRCFANMALK
jgi:hypothetical protein